MTGAPPALTEEGGGRVRRAMFYPVTSRVPAWTIGISGLSVTRT